MHRILSTLLLSGPLLLGTVAPSMAHPTRPDGRPPLAVTALCEGLGEFARRRAQDRDDGIRLSVVQALSRQWDQAHDIDDATRRLHEAIILSVWREPAVPPTSAQKLTEAACVLSAGY